MFKYATLGGLKHEKNNPRTKATKQLLNGMVVLPDDATGNAPTPSSADEAKKAEHVVNNIIDKPEIRNLADFKIEAGEYVHADQLPAVDGLLVQIDEKVVSDAYSSLAVDDVLVSAADGSGKWVKADGTTVIAGEYKVNLVVKEKTTYGGNGFDVLVKAN